MKKNQVSTLKEVQYYNNIQMKQGANQTETFSNDVQNEMNVENQKNKGTGFMKKVLITWCVVLVTLASAKAQATFHRQFAFNPYLSNPGYVAINNNVEASMMYRKQLANFKDAPTTAGISLQMPMSDRVAFGVNLFNDKQVLLSNSHVMGTFGYIIPVAKNQTLRFGLSAGAGMNKLDLSVDEMNTQDPVVTKSAGSNYYIDGNFGMVYTWEGLRVGFALTDLFKSNSFNEQTFNKFQMSNLKNRLYSASYRFDVGMMKNWSVEPYALYRQTTDGKQNYWEVATVAYYKQNIWSGVSYNNNKGMGLILGANVKDMFRFSYSYEFAPFGSNMASGGAHELHLGIRMPSKKVKVYAKNTQQTPRTMANERPAETLARETEREELVLEEAVTTDTDKHQSRLIEDTSAPAATTASNTSTTAKKAVPTAAKESFAMTKGHHYVVVGAFKQMSGSMKYMKELKGKGYKAAVALNPKNNLYYVYIFSSSDQDDSRKMRNEYKLKNLFKEAWLFTMD